MEKRIAIQTFIVGPCRPTSHGFSNVGYRVYRQQRLGERYCWSKPEPIAEVWPPRIETAQRPVHPKTPQEGILSMRAPQEGTSYNSAESTIHLDILDDVESSETHEYSIPSNPEIKDEVVKRIALAAGRALSKNLESPFEGFSNSKY